MMMQPHGLGEEVANHKQSSTDVTTPLIFVMFMVISIMPPCGRCIMVTVSDFPEDHKPPARICAGSQPFASPFLHAVKPHKSEHKHNADLQVTFGAASTNRALLSCCQGLNSCASSSALRVCPPCNCKGSAPVTDDVLSAVVWSVQGSSV